MSGMTLCDQVYPSVTCTPRPLHSRVLKVKLTLLPAVSAPKRTAMQPIDLKRVVGRQTRP